MSHPVMRHFLHSCFYAMLLFFAATEIGFNMSFFSILNFTCHEDVENNPGPRDIKTTILGYYLHKGHQKFSNQWYTVHAQLFICDLFI